MKLHLSQYKFLLIFLFCVIAIWIGLRYIYQINAARSTFEGSIVLHTAPPTRIFIIDPNNIEKKTMLDLSHIERNGLQQIRSFSLESDVGYILLSKNDGDYWNNQPQIFSLKENSIHEVPIIWDKIEQKTLPYALYVYKDKFYIILQALEYNQPNHIYSIPKKGGKARELYSEFRLESIGPASQRDSSPIKYKDGLICVSKDCTYVKFINDECEKELFRIPVEGAGWLKGWYEEGKSLLIWSNNPNRAIVVDLQGNILHEHYRAWLDISTKCWDIYGNTPDAMLIRLNSTLDYFFFLGIDGWDLLRKEQIHMYDYGIYDLKTKNIIPLKRENDIYTINWSSTNYDEKFLQSLTILMPEENT